jgi:hypothetical protein
MKMNLRGVGKKEQRQFNQLLQKQAKEVAKRSRTHGPEATQAQGTEEQIGRSLM